MSVAYIEKKELKKKWRMIMSKSRNRGNPLLYKSKQHLTQSLLDNTVSLGILAVIAYFLFIQKDGSLALVVVFLFGFHSISSQVYRSAKLIADQISINSHTLTRTFAYDTKDITVNLSGLYQDKEMIKFDLPKYSDVAKTINKKASL